MDALFVLPVSGANPVSAGEAQNAE